MNGSRCLDRSDGCEPDVDVVVVVFDAVFFVEFRVNLFSESGNNDAFDDDAIEEIECEAAGDVEGDDEEEGESEGLFPDDEEGSFPEEDDHKKSEPKSDGEAEIEDVFA